MPGVTTTAEAGLDNSAVANLKIPTPETSGDPDKSKAIETSQSLHGQAEVKPYADLDPVIKTSVLGQINEVAFAAAELQKGLTDAYKNDRVFYDAVATIYNNPNHKEFFGLAQQATQEGDAGEAARQQLGKMQLIEFSREEMVVLDASLRKRANQLAYAMGLRRVGTSRYIQWQSDEERVVTGWFGRTRMEKTGNKIDLFEQGILTRADLRGEGFVADLHAPAGATRSLNAPLAEAIRFHDVTRYTESQRLRMLAEVHNASIAFRESAYNMKVDDPRDIFRNDRLSIDIDKQLERLLEQQGKPLDQLTTLPDREYIELYEQATSAAISNLAELQTAAVIENRRDTEFLREDWIAQAEQNATDLRKKTVKTWAKVEADGTETAITTEEEFLKQKIALDRRAQAYQDKIDAEKARITHLEAEIQNAPTRIAELTTEESALRTTVTTSDARLTDIKQRVDFADQNSVNTRYATLLRQTISDPKAKGGTRTRTPEEAATALAQERTSWEQALKDKNKAETKLNELARLTGNVPQTELEAARKELEKQQRSKERVATVTEVEEYAPGVEPIINKIDHITGQGDAERTPVKKLNHIAEVMYTPYHRSQALESFDNLQQAIFITEKNPELHKKIIASGALPDSIMAQSIIDGLGITQGDLVTRGPFGATPGEVDPQGRIDWSAVPAADRETRMAGLEKYLLNLLRQRSPFVTTNVVMGILHERLHAATMVDTSTVSPTDAMQNYAVTAVSFKPGLRERT